MLGCIWSAYLQVVPTSRMCSIAASLIEQPVGKPGVPWQQRPMEIRADRPSDAAAALVSDHGVSIADAHIGAILHARQGSRMITVLSSDPVDLRALAGAADVTVMLP